jgi:hypothetical protein
MVINKVQVAYLLQPKKAIHRKVEPIVPVVPTQKVDKEIPRIFTYEPAKSKKRK